MTKTITIAAIAILTVFTANTAVNAQGFTFNGHNNSGMNYGHRDRVDFEYERSLTHQNPRAAAIGGILQGIAGGLNAADPKKNATASGILGGIGNGIYNASGAHDYRRGSIQRQQQGFQNNWQNSSMSIQRQPSYGMHSGPQVGMRSGYQHQVNRPVYRQQPQMGRPAYQQNRQIGMGQRQAFRGW